MDELNYSFITITGYVEMNKYRYLYFAVLFTAYILIICSNSIIVYIIWTNTNLHEPMYIFIAALLFNCVLYSSTVYPKLLIDFLSENQIISYPACLFQCFIFYSVGGTEFLLLAAMAFDRYVSICKPFRYPAIMRKTTVNVLLILAWLFPVCHISFTTNNNAKAKICSLNLKGIFCNNSIFTLYCVTSRVQAVSGLVTLLDLLVLPLLFTVFTYAKISIISYKKCKTFGTKAAETCTPHLLVLINVSYLTVYSVVITRLGSDYSQIVQFIMTVQLFLYQSLLNPIIYGLKMKEISKLKHFCLTSV